MKNSRAFSKNYILNPPVWIFSGIAPCWCSFSDYNKEKLDHKFFDLPVVCLATKMFGQRLVVWHLFTALVYYKKFKILKFKNLPKITI